MLLLFVFKHKSSLLGIKRERQIREPNLFYGPLSGSPSLTSLFSSLHCFMLVLFYDSPVLAYYSPYNKVSLYKIKICDDHAVCMHFIAPNITPTLFYYLFFLWLTSWDSQWLISSQETYG